MNKSFWKLAEEMNEKNRERQPDFYFENQPEPRKEINFPQFYEETELASAKLAKMDVGRGDRILIAAENSPELLESVYGANRSGAIVSIVNPELAEQKIKHVTNKFSPNLSLIESDLDHDKHKHVTRNSKEVAPLKEINDVGEEKPNIPKANPNQNTEEAAFVLWTSGSTGMPKGVVLSQENLTHNMKGMLQNLDIDHHDRIGSIAPRYHIMGFSYTLGLPFVQGASVHYITKMLNILDTIGKKELTMCVGAPRLFSKLVGMIHRKARHKLDDSIFSRAIKAGARIYIRKKLSKKFRFLASGSSKLPKDVVNSLDELGLKNLEGYGLTETAPLLTMETPGKRIVDSVGIPLPNLSLKIISPKILTEVERGETGEVIVSGKNVFLGYLGAPKKTKEAFLRDWAKEGDRWFRTGDFGYFKRFEGDDYLFIEGREDNRVALATGENVQLEEIEEVLRMPLEDSKLVENFFFKDYETEDGTQLRAVVRPSNLAKKKKEMKRAEDKLERLEQLTAQKIKKELREKDAPSFQVPESVMLVNQINLTNSGDIIRSQDPNTRKIKHNQELQQHFENLKEEKEKRRRELT